MAILKGLPSIQVTIKSDGKTLDEYPDEEDFKFQGFNATKGAISTVFVPCLSDAAFHIKCLTTQKYTPSKLPHNGHVTFTAYVDGKAISEMNTPSARPENWSGVIDHALTYAGKDTLLQQALKFSTLQKVDDANSTRVASDAKIANDGLGEVIVVARRAITVAYAFTAQEAHGNVSEVSEKALKGKAISHGVKFETGTKIRRPQSTANQYFDANNSVVAIFRFKYRSREALQQEMIIPRTSSPEPECIIEEANPLSKAERLARLQAEINQIKSEEEKHPQGRPVKREAEEDGEHTMRGGKKRIQAAGEEVEVVALTYD